MKQALKQALKLASKLPTKGEILGEDVHENLVGVFNESIIIEGYIEANVGRGF